MPKHFIRGDAVKLAKLASLSLALQGCLTNSPKAVVTDASVTESKIAGDAVTSDKILNGTIQTIDLGDSIITTAKIANGVSITGATSSWSGAVTMASTLAVTGNTTVGGTMGITGATTVGGALTVTGAVTGNGNFTIGDSATADAHTVAGSLGLTFSSTSVAGADVAGLTNAMTASPTAASDTDFKAIKNTLSAAPTAAFNAAGSYTGHENQVLLSPTVAQPNLSAWGQVNIARLETPRALNQLVGSFSRAQNSDVDTITTSIASDAELYNDTTGTITNGIGHRAVVLNGSTGTLTNSYAFYGKLDNQAGGTVTRYVGLYLQDPADPTGAASTAIPAATFGIFADGANARNFFEGRVGIGTGMTAPTFQLDVNGTVRLQNISAETNGSYLCVEASGEVTNGGADCAASDRRLKKNIAPIKGSLEKLMALNGVTFEWLDPAKGKKREIGLIAQDVLPQFPEAVEQNSKGYFHVNYKGLVGPLVEAIKELHAKWTSTSDELKQQKLMLGQLERKLEIENLALKTENKQLKERLDKIEHALASIQPKQEQKKGRKLASK